jgi:hypothetical protein
MGLDGVYIDRKGVKKTDRAISQLRSELGTRLTKELAGDQSRCKDCSSEFAKVRGVLDERLGVPVPLEDDALGLIVAEVDLVLQRPCVFGPNDLHGLSGQALELLELANLVKLEPTDALQLTHCSDLQSFAIASYQRAQT